MQPEKDNLDEWVRQLGDPLSKPGAPGVDPEVAALRAAILAEDQVATESAAADELAQARLFKRLEREGLLKGKSPQRKPAGQTHWLRWASAAVMVMAVGLVVRVAMIEPTSIERGFAGTVTIVADDAEAMTRVMQELTAMGLHPKRVAIERRIAFDVSVAQAQLQAFSAWAATHSARAVAPGTYRIFVSASQQ